MIPKRYRVLLLAVLAVVGVVVACVAVVALREDPERARFERIREGMTREDVEQVLGGPPRDISPGGRNWSLLHNGLIQIGHTRHVWGGETGAVRVEFDERGRVENKQWVDANEPFWDRLRRWLHL